MSEIIPDNYWPESVKIIARDGNLELGFLITKEELRDGLFDRFRIGAEQLRFALWQAKTMENENVR